MSRSVPVTVVKPDARLKPCGCANDGVVCLHGIPAVIGTCEDFPITWRNEYLGITREKS